MGGTAKPFASHLRTSRCDGPHSVRVSGLRTDPDDPPMPRWTILPCCAALAVAAAGPRPELAWTAFLGVADCDSVALWRGEAFLACHSPEIRLPVQVSGSQAQGDLMGAYVLRLDPNRGTFVYATRIQGQAFTAALRIKVDADGFASVTGLTKGEGLPVSGDAAQPRFAGGESDAFLVRLSPRGQIVYSTYLGGQGDDLGNAIDLDGRGGVLVGGTTTSGDFPGQRRSRGRDADAFISWLRFSDAESLRSVVFGGSAEEKLTGIAIDGKGGVLGVGYTKSDDYRVLNPVQPELRGASDLFLARLTVPELAFSFSTYLGGSGNDSGWGVTVDPKGAPVVAGTTDSRDLPASDDAFQRSAQGGMDAFVARLDEAGRKTVRLTYFGGSNDDSSGYDGEDIKLDRDGNIWLAGLTSSRDFPVRHAMQQDYGGGETDGFIAVLSPQLTELLYGSYRGGSGRDILEGLDVAPDGTVVVTGLTFSNDVPMPARVQQHAGSDVTAGGDVANAMATAFRLAQH